MKTDVKVEWKTAPT